MALPSWRILGPHDLGMKVNLLLRATTQGWSNPVNGQMFEIKDAPSALSGDLKSFYLWEVGSVSDHVVLIRSPASGVFDETSDFHMGMNHFSELCSGMGGSASGIMAAGFHPLVAIDKSPLACQMMEENGFPQVIHGDLADLETQLRFRQALDKSKGGISAGFPCQPFSRLGRGLKFSDPRAHTFFDILDLAWLTQSAFLLLECVTAAGEDLQVQSTLDTFCQKMNMHWRGVRLQLHRAWPSYRTRWWAMVLPASLPLPELHDLPFAPGRQRIDQIIRSWPRWALEVEKELSLTDEEKACFNRYSKNVEGQILNTRSKCPTLLHSMANHLRECPCGCRLAFSAEILELKGIHATLLSSQHPDLAGTLRHLHPLEAGLMVGIPSQLLTLTSVAPRDILVEVGQVASSIQSHWMAGSIKTTWQISTSPFDIVKIGTTQSMEAQHEAYIQYLLEGYSQRWPSTSHWMPREICIELPNETNLTFSVNQPITVGHVQEAEATFNGRLLRFSDHQGPLRTDVLLKDRLQAEDVAGDLIGFGKEDSANIVTTQVHAKKGLDDLTITREMQKLAQKACLEPSCLLNPRYLATLQEMSTMGQAITCLQRELGEHQTYYGIVWYRHHWIALELNMGENMTLRFFDGLHDHCPDGLESLIHIFHGALPGLQVEWHQPIRQRRGTHCGAIALMLVGVRMNLFHHLDESTCELWHQQLLQSQRFGGNGPTDEQAVLEWLQNFLPSKGVALDAVTQRAQQAMRQLGIPALKEAISAKDPWRMLKQLGNAKSKPFQWVSLSELHQHITKQSTLKHGTSTAKPKKKQPKHRKADPSLHLSPENLEIAPKSFEDADNEDVEAISFQQVQAEARGIAICTVEQAAVLAKEPKNLSIDALALLTIGTLPASDDWACDVESLQWPALYVPTGDPLLIAGSLIQLGDQDVVLRQLSDAPEIGEVETSTLRLQVWKDEADFEWPLFQRGPVKMLLQLFQSLQFCDSTTCNGACARFHAAVDEEIDHVLIDVWSWKWLSTDGKVVSRDAANVFSVFVRVPKSAVVAILSDSGWHGFYAEPRCDQSQGPHPSFAVIWLPKTPLETVQNHKRRHDAILGLARIKGKHGVRVNERDETKILKVLFPERPLVDCKVELLFEVGPLPFGTTKQHMSKLLGAWKWKARPLKPVKGAIGGRFWLVGTNVEPPALHLPTDAGPVTITKTTQVSPPTVSQPSIVGAAKTRDYIQHKYRKESSQSSSSASTDPWLTADPWSRFKPASSPAGTDSHKTVAQPSLRHTELQKKLKEELKDELSKETSDVQMIPVDAKTSSEIQELQAQSNKFTQWFQEAGGRIGALEQRSEHQSKQIDELTMAVNAQSEVTENIRNDVASMQRSWRDELVATTEKQTATLAALLEKRQKVGE